MTLEKGCQILKTRDDPTPVYFKKTNEPPDPDKPYSLLDESKCSWAKQGDAFGSEKLRPRIEPWFTALAQSEHLSMLIGSGLTHAVHRMATGKSLPGMDAHDFEVLNDEIEAEAKRVAQATGRGDGNIEDRIRAANELLRGLEIIALQTGAAAEKAKKQVMSLRKSLEKTLDTFAKSILEGERGLVEAPTAQREMAFNYMVSFLMSFASRSGTRDRLQLFTTNYDRFIEAGADAAGLRLIDRFVGTVATIFRASRMDVDLHYNPPGIRGEPRYLEGVARFTKLHGSVDWLDCDRAIRRIGLPMGVADVAPFVAAPGFKGLTTERLMIYPNAAKDRETTMFPYVELFRDFAASICRPNSTLICYGYSFGDEHINRVIEDMLTIPSTHLVIISHGDPLGQVMNTYENLGRHAQITLALGDHLGDLRALVDHYLPKPAIDKTTFRMAELLNQRWGAQGEDRRKECKTPDEGSPVR